MVKEEKKEKEPNKKEYLPFIQAVTTNKEDDNSEAISYSSKNLTHKDEDEDCLLPTEGLFQLPQKDFTGSKNSTVIKHNDNILTAIP